LDDFGGILRRTIVIKIYPIAKDFRLKILKKPALSRVANEIAVLISATVIFKLSGSLPCTSFYF